MMEAGEVGELEVKQELDQIPEKHRLLVVFYQDLPIL
jgi:hypothetical protein